MQSRFYRRRPITCGTRDRIHGTNLELPDSLSLLFNRPFSLIQFARNEHSYREFYPSACHEWQRALLSEEPDIRSLAAVVLAWELDTTFSLIDQSCDEHQRCHDSPNILPVLKEVMYRPEPALRVVAASAIVRHFGERSRSEPLKELWLLLYEPQPETCCLAAQTLLQTLETDSANRQRVLDVLYDCVTSPDCESRAIAASILLRENAFRPPFSVSSLLEVLRQELPKVDGEKLNLIYPALEEFQQGDVHNLEYARRAVGLLHCLKDVCPTDHPDFDTWASDGSTSAMFHESDEDLRDFLKTHVYTLISNLDSRDRRDRIWSLRKHPWYRLHVRPNIIEPAAAGIKSRFRWKHKLPDLVRDAEAKFLQTVVENPLLDLAPEDYFKLPEAFERKARSAVQNHLRSMYGPRIHRRRVRPSDRLAPESADRKWLTHYERPTSDFLASHSSGDDNNQFFSLPANIHDPSFQISIKDELNRIRQFVKNNATELQSHIFEELMTTAAPSLAQIARRLAVSQNRVYYAYEKLIKLFRENSAIHPSLLFALSKLA